MSAKEIEILLGNKYNEVRVGAVSVMDFQARRKKYRWKKKETI